MRTATYAEKDDERIIYLEAVYRLMHKGSIQVVSDSEKYATYELSSAVYKYIENISKIQPVSCNWSLTGQCPVGGSALNKLLLEQTLPARKGRRWPGNFLFLAEPVRHKERLSPLPQFREHFGKGFPNSFWPSFDNVL